MSISLITVSSHLAKFLAHVGTQKNIWEMNEWMNKCFFQLSGSAESCWVYHQPWPQAFAFMYFLVQSCLLLPFPHSHSHTQETVFYDLSASITWSCQDRFGPWLCHWTCLLFFPASAFHRCDQLSAIFSFKSLITRKTPSPPHGLPRQIAVQGDMNPLITAQLSHSARCKPTWPHY